MGIERIEWNDDAFVAILKSDEVKAELKARGEAIANHAGASGGTYEVIETTGPVRAHVRVETADYKARKAEATDRSLTSALDAGR